MNYPSSAYSKHQESCTYHSVQDDVGGLYINRVGIQKYRAQESNLLDCQPLLTVQVDPIPDIEWMLDEEEDDAGENLCETRTNQPTETWHMISG